MSVDDHGLEAIRKSASQVVEGVKTEYKLRVFSPEELALLQQIVNNTAALSPTTSNIRQQILAAQDREQTIAYSDFGTTNQRVILIAYRSATVGPYTAVKTFEYTEVGTKFRLDEINWTVIED